MRKTLLFVGALLAISVVGLAQTNDPQIHITEDGLGPLPVTQDLGDVQPDQTACENNNGTCSLIFINNTNQIIDGFTFESTFAQTPSFSPPTSQQDPQDYQCGSGYFLTCSATLTLTNGVYTLDFTFSGVDPQSDGNPYENGNPNGLPEGILPGDTFYITLVGWNDGFQNVSLTNSFAVPEASSALVLLTELSLLVGVVAIFRRRLNWKRHFDS